MLVVVVAIAASLGAKAVADAVSIDVAQTAAVQQAAPLARVCANDPGAAARAGADCAAAVAIARDGAKGDPGRGITGTSIVNGRLVLTFSDATTQDVGQVVGSDGTKGAEGRGITSTVVADGRLVITYSDGASADLGPVVGPSGRGIASIDGSSGRLLVTLTDGDVIDAGPLPAGPKGDTGAGGAPAPSIQSSTKTFSDGTIERCTRTGGPDTDPVFDCTRTIPAPPTDQPEPTTDPAPGG